MHDSILDDDLKAFRETVKKFITNEITPYHDEWEKNGVHPSELYQKAGAEGLLCVNAPEEYGGMGLDFRFASVITEEMASAFATGVAFFLHSDVIAPYFQNYGTHEQKDKYLRGMITGEYISSIAMTEPGTGSDLQGIQTKAVLDGDEWVLNGAKTFISNGIISNLCLVVARTDIQTDSKMAPLSLFIVEGDTPGYEKGRNLEKMGLKAQDTAELSFQNCRIPKENILGEEGKGFIYLSEQLAAERLVVAVWSVALAEATLRETIKYTKTRMAFGKSISQFQNTRFKMAEMQTEVEVAGAYVDRVIMQFIQDHKSCVVAASKAKYWASEMLQRVCDEAVQLHGGYGYMWEYPVCRAYADARVQRIYAGTTEIMKEIISRDIFR